MFKDKKIAALKSANAALKSANAELKSALVVAKGKGKAQLEEMQRLAQEVKEHKLELKGQKHAMVELNRQLKTARERQSPTEFSDDEKSKTRSRKRSNESPDGVTKRRKVDSAECQIAVQHAKQAIRTLADLDFAVPMQLVRVDVISSLKTSDIATLPAMLVQELQEQQMRSLATSLDHGAALPPFLMTAMSERCARDMKNMQTLVIENLKAQSAQAALVRQMLSS